MDDERDPDATRPTEPNGALTRRGPGARREFAPGAIIGAYRIEELRYEGGFAAIYLAHHLETGRAAALKVLLPYLSTAPHALERLRREAAAINQLRHPHIVEILECGEHGDGRPYIAMEWLEGRNLEEELRIRGSFTATEALAIMEELCGALAAAHACGIVHRDVKAQNVVALPRGEWLTTKLVDFGIAKLLHTEHALPRLTASRQSIGTPLTMAPEQILGQAIDARTDVYGLGIMLFQLVTGRLPFRGATSVETEELHLSAPPPRAGDLVAVPAQLDAVIQRCLEKSRTRRYPGVGELVADLRASVTAAPAAEVSRPGVALYVEARIVAGPPAGVRGGDLDDAVLDDVEAVLTQAREMCAAAGLPLAMESSNALLAAAALPVDGLEARALRAAVVQAAAGLARALAARAGASAQVELLLMVHVAPATVRDRGGRLVLGGALLRLREWTRGLPAGVLVASNAALADLAPELVAAVVRAEPT